ncbi:TetR/AcrR family transcriptional regulator [Streptomyces cacaoi]|uniref:TetR/AcrR family transcriptional regulator n=1 Tax=Streptomyces cacaoi TaxID=1898 RepID=UPI0011F11F36|nr:TetR/AcrR family transcriptional regulator [Streptomyces cacaoi]
MPKVTAAYFDARRQEILTAARALFADKGFVRTSMSDIAAAAGLSAGAVYRYFPSRSHLVLAMCGEEGGGAAEATGDTEATGATEAAGGDGEPALGGTAAESVETLRRQVDPRAQGLQQARLVTQIWGSAVTDDSLATVATRRHAALRDQLAGLIEQGGADGGGRPAPRDEAEFALAALIGYAALVATDAPVDHDGFARALSRVLG